ncbi:unnamed protein product [Lampetra fluviatilis]
MEICGTTGSERTEPPGAAQAIWGAHTLLQLWPSGPRCFRMPGSPSAWSDTSSGRRAVYTQAPAEKYGESWHLTRLARAHIRHTLTR